MMRCWLFTLLLVSMIGLISGCGPQATTAAPGALASAAEPSQPVPTTTATATRVPFTPLATESGLPPIQLRIPEIGLGVEVVKMAWQVSKENGQRHSQWQVPLDQAGWHINSAKPGTAGNVILSGHHRIGSAVFAPLAQGGVRVDQTIEVVDELGRVWLYVVKEVSAPIPVLGANASQQTNIAAYLEDNSQPRLTLLTGWPEFSDTHLLFVVAELVGSGAVGQWGSGAVGQWGSREVGR